MNKIKINFYHQKILADMLTPVSIYAKLRDHFNHPLLLESADYHDRSDSISYICLEPIAGFEAKGLECKVQFPETEHQQYTVSKLSEVLGDFQSFLRTFEPPESNLPFPFAGLFGYTSFEAVQYMEDITLHTPKDDLKSNPDLKYNLFKFVLVFDHFKNELHLLQFSTNNNPIDIKETNAILDLLRVTDTPMFSFKKTGAETSPLKDEDFKKMVETGIAHCQRGDVFQVVLSRSFQQPFLGDDFCVYRTLRSINPSPYLFYFDYGSFRLMGSSPESQIQITDQAAAINPIAGTVRRSDDLQEDQARATHLKNDPKENAEHVMLVDLARNDLSKHADKVAVDVYAEIQYFSHVIHMVSKVSGQLSPQQESLQVFSDTFPAGTLSGAPKYRALEIIRNNEPNARNFYGGAIGFLGFDRTINHAILIRSVLSKNNTLVYQAGAGIVVDSQPQKELEEVNNKVAALRKAIQKAHVL